MILSYIAIITLIISSVNSEYTWNGSEWVWSEAQIDKTNHEVQSDDESNYEGSGQEIVPTPSVKSQSFSEGNYGILKSPKK